MTVSASPTGMLSVDARCIECELNRVHEVVDVETVADSAAIIQPPGSPGQEFGREARLPDGSRPRDDAGSQNHKLDRAPGAQTEEPTLCPRLRMVVRDRLATPQGTLLVGAGKRRLSMTDALLR